MKKLLLLIMIAGLLSVTILPLDGLAAASSSNDEEDTLFPGTVFESIQELETAIIAYRQEPIVYGGDVDQFFATANSIYIPAKFADKNSYIKQIVTFPSYFEIQYIIDGKIYLFDYYFTKRSGEWLINSTKESYINKKSPENLTKEYLLDEKVIYAYYTPDFSYTASDLGESYYVWTQNDMGFYWRIPDEKPNEKYISWCDIVSIPLNVQSTSKVEQSIDKVNNNPQTGR